MQEYACIIIFIPWEPFPQPLRLRIRNIKGGIIVRKKTMVKVSGLLLLTAIFFMVAGTPSSVQANPAETEGTISVYGETVITATPDLARIVLAVETTHESAKTATEENARLMEAVINALVKSGLDKKQLKTSGYRVYSYNEPIDPANRDNYVTLYKASNELNITLRNLNETGNVIDTAIKAGANRVLAVWFELENAEALKLQALKYATAQAMTKANAIAKSAGITTKGIKAIREEGSSYTPFRAEDENLNMKMAGGASTPILPGDVEVMARVNAEFYF
jgi:uncharacterized protein YggE